VLPDCFGQPHVHARNLHPEVEEECLGVPVGLKVRLLVPRQRRGIGDLLVWAAMTRGPSCHCDLMRKTANSTTCFFIATRFSVRRLAPLPGPRGTRALNRISLKNVALERHLPHQRVGHPAHDAGVMFPGSARARRGARLVAVIFLLPWPGIRLLRLGRAHLICPRGPAGPQERASKKSASCRSRWWPGPPSAQSAAQRLAAAALPPGWAILKRYRATG